MNITENILIKLPLWSVRKALRIMILAFLGSLLIGIVDIYTLYEISS